MLKLFDALKGIGGEFEVQRVLGALGTVTYTLAAPLLVATEIIKGVSLTEFSLAFPAGLATCIGATAGAIALKDRNVATAKVVERTGAVPAPPPAGPRVVAEPIDGAKPAAGERGEFADPKKG
ncbi:MAG: hypothetical protein E6Q77_00540 [Rhizobium sp.]|jgi:hypothetical protein|nr:MAG: hypothetical protein E6Q77_00540 [Rhizobium sp.]